MHKPVTMTSLIYHNHGALAPTMTSLIYHNRGTLGLATKKNVFGSEEEATNAELHGEVG